MRHALRVVLSVAFVLGGCASKPPLNEVRMVSKAYGQLNAAAQPLFDDLALSERQQGKTAAMARARNRADGKPVAATAGAALTSAVKALQPLVDLAARDANAEEFERLVRKEAPRVEAVIVALRDSAPEFFNTVTGPAFARFSKEGLTSTEISRNEAARIENDRMAVSNFVVLLEQYRELLLELVAAYDKRGGQLTLSGLP